MWSSLRSAFRSLSRDRGFTTLAIILIAVTGGATTAVYAVIDAVMLAPMPFADEERTVVIWMRDVARDSPVVEIGLGEAHATARTVRVVGVARRVRLGRPTRRPFRMTMARASA